MVTEEHIRTAHDFLQKSDGYFAEDDVLQGSEKLWGAVVHAVTAVAQQRGCRYGNHQILRQAALRIADELDDNSARLGFAVAEKFHANLYHDFMEDGELDMSRPLAKGFVWQMLALADNQEVQP